MPVQVSTSFSMDDTLRLLRQHEAEVRARYGVRSLALFGSAVRGEVTADSDLDVLVEFERPPSLFEFVRLQQHLSDLLGMRVDLVMKSALKPAIGKAILAEIVAV
jgi:uncharacterized protein